jgi:hypothetical protein
MDLKANSSRQPLVEVLAAAPADSPEVIVLPGVPFYDAPTRPEHLYPATTIDILKILRTKGVSIDYAEPSHGRATLELMAWEYWVPIVVFGYEALAHGVGGLFTEAVLGLIGKANTGRTKMYARVGRVTRDDETIEWLEASGRTDAVIPALREFLAPKDE